MALPVPDDFYAFPADSSYDTFSTLMRMYNAEMSRAVLGTAISQEVRACGSCGSWSKPCDCPRVAISMTAHCYLCDAQHDPRVQAPRVCDACRKRYL